MSSNGGKLPIFLPQYGIGKAGKDSMARHSAFELSRYNVAFLSLWPGSVKTEFVKESLERSDEMEGMAEQIEATKAYFFRKQRPQSSLEKQLFTYWQMRKS